MTAPTLELTYTSFDSAHAERGGWQVKDMVGLGVGFDRSLLLEGTRPSLDPVAALPRFPSPRELEQQPRRLVHRPIPGGHSALWHTVEAGVDGSGRPGNTFVHAMIVSDMAADAPRAIELWRSPGWLVPHGPDDVSAAALVEPPRQMKPSGLFGAHQSAQFLFDEAAPPRLFLMGALLDAAHLALDDGPQVVLVSSNPDEAARWICAICRWTSPGQARRLAWSTFERVNDLEHPSIRDLHIVAVPERDLAALTERPGKRIIIRLDEDPDLEGPSEAAAWSLDVPQSLRVPQTLWSQMALEVSLLGVDSTREALDGLDATGSPVPIESLELPLSQWLLEQDSDRLARAQALAQRALTRATRSVEGTPPAFVSWRALAHGDHSPPGYRAAALRDRPWLTSDVLAPSQLSAPPSDEEKLAFATAMAEAVDEIRTALAEAQSLGPGLSDDGVGNVLYGLRLLDFVVRLGNETPDSDERLAPLCRDLAQALRMRGAGQAVRRCGQIEQAAMRCLLASLAKMTIADPDVATWAGLPPSALSRGPVRGRVRSKEPAAATARSSMRPLKEASSLDGSTPRSSARGNSPAASLLPPSSRAAGQIDRLVRGRAGSEDKRRARQLLHDLRLSAQRPFMGYPAMLLQDESTQRRMAGLAALTAQDWDWWEYELIGPVHVVRAMRLLLDHGKARAVAAELADHVPIALLLLEQDEQVHVEQVADFVVEVMELDRTQRAKIPETLNGAFDLGITLPERSGLRDLIDEEVQRLYHHRSLWKGFNR